MVDPPENPGGLEEEEEEEEENDDNEEEESRDNARGGRGVGYPPPPPPPVPPPRAEEGYVDRPRPFGADVEIAAQDDDDGDGDGDCRPEEEKAGVRPRFSVVVAAPAGVSPPERRERPSPRRRSRRRRAGDPGDVRLEAVPTEDTSADDDDDDDVGASDSYGAAPSPPPPPLSPPSARLVPADTDDWGEPDPDGVDATDPSGGNDAVGAGGDQGGGGNRENDMKLIEDTYTLIFTAGVWSQGFVYGVSVFFFQMCILGLLLVDLLGGSSEYNRLGVPPDVTWQVRVSQLFAAIILTFTDDDMLSSLNFMGARYDMDGKKFPEATNWKRRLSCLSRALEGVLSILVSFIFTMQVDTVLDLFMSLAALKFIQELDNVAFKIARDGYMGAALEAEVKKLREVPVPRASRGKVFYRVSTPMFTWKLRYSRIRRSIFLLILAGLIAGWAIIWQKQVSGQYFVKSYNVQFGDHYWQRAVYEVVHYWHFSGTYELAAARTNGRPVYYERGWDDSGRFFYCEEEGAWVFSIHNVIKTERDRCNWLLRSPKTDATELASVPTSGWYMWTGVVRHPPIDFFFSPAECNKDGDCSFNGECRDKKCVCDDPWIGHACGVNEEERCDTIGSKMLGDFSLIRDFPAVYDRPVYYQIREDTPFSISRPSLGWKQNCTDKNFFLNAIVYTGMRWDILSNCFDAPIHDEEVRGLLSKMLYISERDGAETRQGLWGKAEAHGHWRPVYDEYGYFRSDQTAGDVPLLVEFSQWVAYVGDYVGGYMRKLGEDSVFHCKVNTCGWGQCSSYGTDYCKNDTLACVCNDGWEGIFCEREGSNSASRP